ncbi:hypothetical protein BVRB_8g184780, partial [Beta vulgaris subsp. vulgaris]
IRTYPYPHYTNIGKLGYVDSKYILEHTEYFFTYATHITPSVALRR